MKQTLIKLGTLLSVVAALVAWAIPIKLIAIPLFFVFTILFVVLYLKWDW
jgi:hypothetical protein